jgi:hypothetical protein
MRSPLKHANRRPGAAPGGPSGISAPRAGAAVALLLALIGCGSNDDARPTGQVKSEAAATPDPDDVPITEADVPVPAGYPEAVERLCGYRDAIRQAVESGHLGKAHRPLDETNIAIERLPSVARADGVPRRLWEEVVAAGEDLGEALDEIHTEIDAGRKPDYAAHAEAIDKALARLQAIHKTNHDESVNETQR